MSGVLPASLPNYGGSGGAGQVHHDEVVTSESTGSSSFTDLTTVGPQVTMTPPASGKVKVTITSQIANALGAVGVALSGGNVVAASDDDCLLQDSGRESVVFILEGLAAEETTFTLKYRHVPGTTSTSFMRRVLIVEPVS